MDKKPQISASVRYTGVRAIARRAKVAPCTISRILHGERRPGKALAKRLKRLGIEVGGGMEAKESGEGEGMKEAGNA